MRAMYATDDEKVAARTVRQRLKAFMHVNLTGSSHVYLGVRPSYTYRSRHVMESLSHDLREEYWLE